MADRVLVAGTDEAGYGPNLGPLVITATVWEIPGDIDPRNLWDHLSEVLTNAPSKNDRRLFVADSKQVYSPSDGVLDLETGVLSLLSSLFPLPQSISDLGKLLGGDSFVEGFQQEPWNHLYVPEVPVESLEEELLEFRRQILAIFDRTDIRLRSVASRVLFPLEFNELVAQADSKGIVLSNATMKLIRDSISDPNQRAWVFCDKHGGRNRYDELISSAYDDAFVFRLEESMERSRYRMGNLEFCFRTKAEELLPVALASMVSKYLREVLMVGFNQFWQDRIPDLRPTKGYPVDARRFLEDISAKAEELNIPQPLFWRSR